MKHLRFLSVMSVMLCLSVTGSVLGMTRSYSAAANAFPDSEYKSGSSPVSSTVSENAATATATTNPYSAYATINAGYSSKLADAVFQQTFLLSELGFDGGSGTVGVTGFYSVVQSGPTIGGVRAGLRVENLLGTFDEDVKSYIEPVNDSGMLYAEVSGSFSSGIRIVLDASVSAGGGSYGTAEVAITSITANGQTIFITGFLPGDFNNDGVVSAADYVVWRDNKGGTAGLPNGASADRVSQGDYDRWVASFGNTLEVGPEMGAANSSAIPEPGSAILAFAAICLCLAFKRITAADRRGSV